MAFNHNTDTSALRDTSRGYLTIASGPPTLFRGGITQKPGKIYILSVRNERRIYLRVAFRTTRSETRSIRGFYLRNERFNRCFACGKHRCWNGTTHSQRGDGCRAIVISKLRRNEYTYACIIQDAGYWIYK